MPIKYGLPYCVTCPRTHPGSLNPRTRRSRVPGWWDPGIRTNTEAGDSFGKTYSTCIIAQVLGNCHIPWLAFCVRGRWWVAAESWDLWSGALRTTCTTTTTNTFAFNDTSRHEGHKNWIEQVLLGLLSSCPVNHTCYQYNVVGEHCTLCVQVVLTVGWCQLAWRAIAICASSSKPTFTRNMPYCPCGVWCRG